MAEHTDTERLEWLLGEFRTTDLYNALGSLPRGLEETRAAIDAKIDEELAHSAPAEQK